MKKAIYLIMFILLFSFVSALNYRTNQYFYLNLTSNAKDERGNFDFTNCAAAPTFGSSGADFELSSSQCINANPSTELLSSGSKSFGLCFYTVPESLTATMILYDEHQDSSSKGPIIRIGDSGGGVYKFNLWHDGTSAYLGPQILAGSGYKICYTFNESNNQNSLWVNTTIAVKDTSDVSDGTGTAIVHMARYSHTTAGYYDGIIKEFCGWRNTTTGKVLTEGDVSTYLSYGCDGTAPAPPVDTTPPSITNVIQYPLNASVINLANQHLLINATVTDAVKVLWSNLSFKLNKTSIYFNGTLINPNATIKNMSTSGTTHKWDIDEAHLLGGTYPLNFSLFETMQHFNTTLSSTNQLIKMQFLNVSNTIQSNFYEIMAQNTTPTGTTKYYYCNSSYTTGNPSINNNCVNFYTVNINRPFNHTHGKSKHKIIPLGINTTSKKIGSVYVTPTSYIIKQITSGSELVFYINKQSRATTTQISSNTGNTWSSQSYTIDAHIHQIEPKASFNYKICAKDNSSNSACTGFYSDIFEFPKLPPSGVSFYSPLGGYTYNDSILINHTESISPSGQNIINYTYYYSKDSEESFTKIATVTDLTGYTWDITAIENDDYYLKVIIMDSLGLSSFEYSDVFTIYNPPSLSEILLANINNNLTEINEAVNMIAFIILFIVSLLLYIFIIDNTLLDLFNVVMNLVLTYVFAIGNYVIFSWLSLLLAILLISRIYSSKPN